MDSASRAELEAWLRYFDDLGIQSFYSDRSLPHAAPRLALPVEIPRLAPSLGPPPSVPRAVQPAPARYVIPQQAPSLFDAPVKIVKDQTLEDVRADLGDCTRCKLCERRTHIVFGDGNPRAELVFVGEGPGHDEDIQGLPFVGRAGRLLTDMITAMGLERRDVYICNVIKCRPPENRLPEKDEVAACSPFLFRQLEVIRPKVIVALGASAVKTLLGDGFAITKVRGQWFDFRGFQLLPTYHPAYLLRNPAAKPDSWKDLQKVMAVLGLEPKKRK